jgi:hypothetical protein
MIRIISNGQELELSSDTSIEVEWESWLFSDDNGVGKAFSYPIAFPLSDRNKILLGHRHLVQRVYEDIEVSVWLYNFFFTKCKLSYRIEGGKATGSLKLDESEVNTKLRNKTLQEVIQHTIWLGKTVTEVRNSLLALSSAVPASNAVVFAPMYNPDFNKDFEADGYVKQPYINYFGKFMSEPIPKFFVDGEYTVTLPGFNRPQNVKGKFFGYHLVPFPYLTWVLERVFEWLGLSVVSSFLEQEEIKRRVLYNNVALESLLDRPVSGVVVNVADHLPRMKVLDFLKAIRKHFALQLDFNSREQQVVIRSFREIQERDDYQDLTRWLVNESMTLDPPAVSGYTVKFAGDDPIDKEVKRLESSTVGDGDKGVTDEVGTMTMQRQQRMNAAGESITSAWLVPASKQAGNVRGFLYKEADGYIENSELKEDFGIRMMTYRGFQKDSTGALYPMLTANRYDYGQNAIGTLADDPNEALSVYELYQKPYYTFLTKTRKVKMPVLMPVGDFLRLKLFRKIGVKGRDLVLTRYVIDKMVAQLPGKGGFVKVQLYAYPTLPGAIGPNTAGVSTVVWLRMEFEFNPENDLVDVYVRAYTSADQTRKLAVVGLAFFYEKKTYDEAGVRSEELSNVLNGSEVQLYSDFENFTPATTEDGVPTQITFALMASPNYFIIS